MCFFLSFSVIRCSISSPENPPEAEWINEATRIVATRKVQSAWPGCLFVFVERWMGLSWKFPNHIDFDWFHGTDPYIIMIHIVYTYIYTVYIYIHIIYRVLFWCPMGCDLIGDWLKTDLLKSNLRLVFHAQLPGFISFAKPHPGCQSHPDCGNN